jgi:hypothetical protein
MSTPANEALAPYKKMSTPQLMRATKKIQELATGTSAEDVFWEGYDRQGLFDVLTHHLPKLAKKEITVTVQSSDISDLPDEMDLDEDLADDAIGLKIERSAGPNKKARTPKAPKEPKAPKVVVPKPPFKVGSYVQTSEGVVGIVDSLAEDIDGDQAVNVRWLDGEVGTEPEHVPTTALLKASKPKVVKPPKVPKVKAPKATFKNGTKVDVNFTNGDPVFVGKVSSTSFDENGNELVTVANEAGETINNAILSQVSKHVRQPKPAAEPKERKRRLSPEIVTAIRTRRVEVGGSYATIAAWLKEEHDIQVTGDLVRSIVIGEIYKDLPLVEPAPVAEAAAE